MERRKEGKKERRKEGRKEGDGSVLNIAILLLQGGRTEQNSGRVVWVFGRAGHPSASGASEKEVVSVCVVTSRHVGMQGNE